MYLNKVPSSATHGFLAAGTSVNSFRTCSQDSDEACMPQSSKPAAAAATATLEHELGRQRERATAAERALAESHKANELLAGRVLALQAELSQAKAAVYAREGASQQAQKAAAEGSLCNSQHCSAAMLQREVNRLKAKMDQRAIELLVEQQKVQDAEQRLQDADERQQEADERLQEHNGQLQASARTLHAAEAQLNAARRDFAKAHKQRQEAVSKMVEQGRQLASMEAKATEWEKVADVARSKHYDIVRRVMIVVVKAAVAIELLNKALRSGPNLANTQLGAAIASNVEVLGALIALRSELVNGDAGALGLPKASTAFVTPQHSSK